MKQNKSLTIPCKFNKCLLYPACKYKTVISCKILFNWMIRKGNTIKTWLYITKTLPKIHSLKVDRIWFNAKYIWPEKFYDKHIWPEKLYINKNTIFYIGKGIQS